MQNPRTKAGFGDTAKMTCCTHACNEGRTCPHRFVDPRPFSALVLVGIASLYVAVLIVAWGGW